MKRTPFYMTAALMVALLLAACATDNNAAPAQNQPAPTMVTPATPTVQAGTTAQVATEMTTTPVSEAVTAAPSQTAPAQAAAGDDLTRTDEQGAVVVRVKPLNLSNNLSNPGETLDFDVAMDTHSVDLSMDLGTLATLTTDNGRSVPATKWDAPAGGHHAEGTLLFPAKLEGVPILEGATRLTLTLRNVDAPERVFTWNLQ